MSKRAEYINWFFHLAFFCILLAGSKAAFGQNANGASKEERVILYTDKTSYLAGEIIWLKGILLNDSIITNLNGSKILYVQLFNNTGNPVSNAKLSINDGTAEGSFYLPFTFSSGVYTLAAYTAKTRNKGTGNIFRKKIVIINTVRSGGGDSVSYEKGSAALKPEVSQNVKVIASKSIYAAREKIDVTLTPGPNTGIIKGSVSISYQPAPFPGFADNEIPLPGQSYTGGHSTNRYMMPEYDGHIITARVTNTWNQQPAAGIKCALSIPAAVPFGFYLATSDSSGIARFNVKRYYGPGSVILKTFSEADQGNYKVEILTPFINNIPRNSFDGVLWVNQSDSFDLRRRSIAVQAMNNYHAQQLSSFRLPALSDTLPFFGKPEVTYRLDDYKRFSTMEEVLREYVTNITVSLREGKLRMNIYNEKDRATYKTNILVLLDGVPLSDPNSIFNYDPLKVKKLDIVPMRYVIGNALFSGVASFETYDSRFDGFDIDPAAVSTEYDGLQLKRNFYSPVYTNDDKGNLRIPDYRTTLLWEPGIVLKPGKPIALTASSSDFKGVYKIVFSGISENGQEYYGENTIEVK